MNPMKSDEDIDAIVDELLDDVTAAAWGQDARFRLVLLLGLMDGDVVMMGESGNPQLSMPAAEIERTLAAARAAKAAGRTMAEHFGI